MRSASGWAAWCFQSLIQAWGLSRYSGSRQSGVPSAMVGSMVQAVKSMPMPMTSAGSTPLSASRPARWLEHLDVVVRVLQRPVRLELDAALGQRLVDNAVGIVVHGRGDLAAVGHIDQQGAAGSVPKSMPIAYLRPWFVSFFATDERRWARMGHR